jgi:hypothetical protein
MTDEKFNRTLDELSERRRFFSENFPDIPGMKGRDWSMPNTCPTCGFYSLSERDSWEVCGICFWEDDGQDDKEFGKFNDPNKIMGGPNGQWSLTSYRQFFFENLEDKKLLKGTRIKTLFRKFDHLRQNFSADKKEEILEIIQQLEKEFKPFHELRMKKK